MLEFELRMKKQFKTEVELNEFLRTQERAIVLVQNHEKVGVWLPDDLPDACGPVWITHNPFRKTRKRNG